MSVPVKLKSRLRTIKSLNSIFAALQVITTAKIQTIRSIHGTSMRFLSQLEGAARHLDLLPNMNEKKSSKVLAILISSNRGLCGGFNQNLFYRVGSFIKEQGAAGAEVDYVVFGKKGQQFLKSRNQQIKQVFAKEYVDPTVFFELAEDLLKRLLSGQISGVYVISNRYRSVMKQDALVHKLLPIEGPEVLDESYFILEPQKEAVKSQLLLHIVAARLFHFYMDSQLGELSSRLFTLKGAIENSKELIDRLVLDLNKVRQQSITRDLLEIISSSECLSKGRCN